MINVSSLFLCLFVLFFLGCMGAGTNAKITNYQKIIKDNDQWYIYFAYDYGEQKEETTAEGKTKKSITKSFPQQWLSYLDGIYFELKGAYQLHIEKIRPEKKQNYISINPVINMEYNFIQSVTITIFQQGNLKSKIDIVNEGSVGCIIPIPSPPYKINKLAKFTAEKIYKIINK